MGTKSLVEALKKVFEDVRQNGLRIDAFMLAPAYPGFIQDAYILAVSAPSMINWHCYDKTDTLIDLLHAQVAVEDRILIDRVRVYDSIEELKQHAQHGFDDTSCAVCEWPLIPATQLIEIEA